MNRYILKIKTKFGFGFDDWNFIIIAEDRMEYVKAVINEYKHMYESPVELMDYICDIYGWEWEDLNEDILIEM